MVFFRESVFEKRIFAKEFFCENWKKKKKYWVQFLFMKVKYV